MSNVNAESKHCELTDEELDQVSGAGKRIATKEQPTESISLSYEEVKFEY